MKLSDLTEYNKGDVGEPVDINRLQKLKQQSTFLTKFNRNELPVNIFKTVDHNSVWFILEYNNNIIGYIRTEMVPNTNILQAKDEQIFSQFRNQGIGTELYITLARIGGLRFIHDIQLSDTSENMWKNKLVSQHIVKGIYDKILDKVYQLSDIGNYTSDGKVILDPANDTTDPIIDYDGEGQRFFWILESINAGYPITEILNAQQKFYLHGHDLLYIDLTSYNRARMTPKILNEYNGF